MTYTDRIARTPEDRSGEADEVARRISELLPALRAIKYLGTHSDTVARTQFAALVTDMERYLRELYQMRGEQAPSDWIR